MHPFSINFASDRKELNVYEEMFKTKKPLITLSRHTRYVTRRLADGKVG